ncbi:hypothetical protein QQM39_10090 [Streptomyces sp. DT2A-34]|uniref:hypothetical protein n=1 Tax=Streptomyces sp. DT2A-34 TaxID=3051182 RepID=UPI00265C081D|nr:hypothetical protein [Streptomyces sp. DT2A-34]MDO0911191.1 hypothetical protein [Streptomyces sp. DT2A-34]
MTPAAGESAAGDVVHVVADRFRGFAGNAGVITLGALRRVPASTRPAADSTGRAPAAWRAAPPRTQPAAA